MTGRILRCHKTTYRATRAWILDFLTQELDLHRYAREQTIVAQSFTEILNRPYLGATCKGHFGDVGTVNDTTLATVRQDFALRRSAPPAAPKS